MSPRKYGYQAEKLAAARRCLMLPHPYQPDGGGEARSIANAFVACYQAFRELPKSNLDSEPLEMVQKLEEFMDTSSVGHLGSSVEGAAYHRALEFTEDEKREFAKLVDELADWFKREHLGIV